MNLKMLLLTCNDGVSGLSYKQQMQIGQIVWNRPSNIHKLVNIFPAFAAV